MEVLSRLGNAFQIWTSGYHLPGASFHTILFLLSSILLLLLVWGSLLWSRRSKVVESADSGNERKIQDLRSLKWRHETASFLSELVDKDGAGAWPPRANHSTWPVALRPYKEIYLQLSPLLPAAEPSLDDAVNSERRSNYRSLMAKVLAERVDVAQVEELLAAVEAGNWDLLPRDAYNGFYACVAVCRHAYRWATIPVVKVAQLETVVDFPKELCVPWPYLQQRFGVTAESGNNTANVLHNFDERGERVYKINVGMSDLITSSEEVFFRMFYNLEILAFPIYYEMIRAVISFEKSDKEVCLEHLKNITWRLRHLLLVFYENLTESRVSRSVWLSYIQGFQGWGIGVMVKGELVKYDGLSGNHVLFFQALDAFLGLDRYLSDENMIRYIPFNQRNFCLGLKKHCIRNKLKDQSDTMIEDEMKKIVNHLKVFRSAHRARVMPYLEQPAPERLTMTAGKSVLEGPTTKDTKAALKVLDQMLATRLRETI